MKTLPLELPALAALLSLCLTLSGNLHAQSVRRAAPPPAQDSERVVPKSLSASQAQAILEEEGISVLPQNLAGIVMNARPDLVEAFLTLGVSPNAKVEPMPQTPLELAATSCIQWREKDEGRLLNVFDVLLAHGADPNLAGMPQLGTMLTAAQQCPGSVIERLHKAGGNLQARNPQGITPLSMALLVNNLDAAETLIRLGARLPAATAKKLAESLENPEAKALLRRATAPAR